MKTTFHAFFLFTLIFTFAMTANAGQVSLQDGADGKYVNMPVTGYDTLVLDAATSFTIYDDGGDDAPYSSNADGYLVITVPSGLSTVISGTVNTETGYDYLKVYKNEVPEDGEEEDGYLLLGRADGNDVDVSLTSTERKIILYFHSDGSVVSSGLELNVSLVDATTPHMIALNQVNGGTVASDKMTATYGEEVSLTLTPSESNLIKGVSVVDESGNIVKTSEIDWFSGTSTVKFAMPGSDVSVTPAFGSISVADGAYINMPISGTKNITIPAGISSFKAYDDGGKDGYYSNSARGFLVLRAPEGMSLMVSGTVNTEYNCDYLTAYNGYMDEEFSCEGDCSELIPRTSGSNVVIGPVISSGNIITLYFYSDGSSVYSGLDLTVSVFDASTPRTVSIGDTEGGSVSSDKTTALVGELVTLTVVPDGNNFTNGISVVDEDGNSVKVSGWDWLSGGYTATFVMPTKNVTVNAVFAESITAEGGAFINMPTSGTTSITIPEGVTSFKVYDDGGKDGNHSLEADGYLEIYAPTGYSLKVSGTINSQEGCGYVTIYDGIRAYQQILDQKSGSNVNVGPAVSTENVMTIRFSPDYCSVKSGLDLTVTLVDKTIPHAITLNSTDGGTVSSDKLSAAMGETVTLTLAPSEGKLISGVSVVGADGTPVEVTGGNWYSGNTATFVMPIQEVEVTAVFTDAVTAEDGSFINMPVSGERRIEIPAGVTSFKVYDDGGKDGEYSNNAYGTLVLVAPEGKQLMISGTMHTEEGYDEIMILDGEYGYETLLAGTGGALDIEPMVSALGGVQIRFQSDGGVVYSGFDLTVSVIDMNIEYAVTVNSAPGGQVISNVSSAKVGDDIALSITPNEGYLLSGIEVKGTEDQQLIKVEGGEWYSDENMVYFTMPNKDVTITPVFTNDLTAEGGLKLDMLSNDYKQYVYVPEGVRSFRVKYNDYIDYASTNLSLYAPEGYVFRVEDLEDNVSAKYFQIIDYSEYGDNCIWGYWCGNVSPSVSSYSDNLMMRVYAQEEEFTLDMKVTLVDATKSHAVNVATGIQGGSVQSEVSSAMLGEYVELTVTPNENYLLASIDVIDSVGNAVKVENGSWYSEGAAYFKMPVYDVTVTPAFTNDFSNLSINMPTYGNTVVANIPASVTSFKVYDDGGADNDYTQSGSNYIVLNAPEGYVFHVTGEVSLMSNDYLSIYDGDLSGDVLLRRFTGYEMSVGSISSTGRTMTLLFHTDGGNVSEGLDLTVELVDATAPHLITIASSIRGVVTSDVTSASVGQTVTLTAVPKSPYMLMEISVSDENGNPRKVSGGTWCTSNTATFTMPYADVNVSATYTNLLTAAGGLYVNMPSSGTKTINIPEGVQSFKVYDDGGASAISSEGANGLLEMRAPLGYKFEVSGTVRGSTSASITFAVYDGDNQTNAIWKRGVNYYSGAVNVSVSGTGSIMTLDFDGQDGKGSGGLANLDLTVSLVQAQSHTIALANYDENGGTAAIDKETAYPGETVTLTTHSATGYVLAGVNVVNSESNPVKTSATTWNADNTVTFVMPDDAVTVTPQFTNNLTAEGGLYLRLPSGGTSKTFTVPEGVTSFKLYAADVSEGLCHGDDQYDNIIELSSSNGSNFLIEGTIGLYSWLEISEKESDEEFASIIGRYYNGSTSTDIGQYQSARGTVTISYDRCDDLDLTVTVGGVATQYAVTIANAVGGTVTSDKEMAVAGEQVRLSITPDNTHLIERLDADNPYITGSIQTAWYMGDYVSFMMPAADVTITPVFSDALTAEDGLYINMPSGWNDINASIPSKVKSFKIYDDGGEFGNYTPNSRETISLMAPEGYTLRVVGTITAAVQSELNIYVGGCWYDEEESDYEIRSSGDGVTTDIGSFTARCMQLTFNTCSGKECDETYSGLDLTVTLVPYMQYAAVSVTENEEGQMVANINGSYDGGEDVNIPEEIDVDTVVLNRDFPVGGSSTGYATIVLPFDINGASVDGWRQVVEFAGIDLDDNNKKYVKMYRVWCRDDVDEECATLDGNLKAYTPYMVQMDDGSLEFHGPVKLLPTEEPIARVGKWEFRGTLSNKVWEEDDEDMGRIYGFASRGNEGVAVGQFAKALPGARIGALRAYMVRDEDSAPYPPYKMAANSAPVNTSVPEVMEIVIVNRPKANNVEEHTDVHSEEKIETEHTDVRSEETIEEERSVNPPAEKKEEPHTMVIGRINTRTGEITLEQNYDIKGRKLNGKPTARSVFYSEKKLVK